MSIKRICLGLLVILNVQMYYAWASTGHRVIGEVASEHIKHRTKRKIIKLLNNESIASISTFGDDIKSDDRYKKFYTWHFVDFDYGKKYEESEHHKEGDLVQAIEYCENIIKDKNASQSDKVFYLKLLVHFVGDLHQPLHVGREADEGGNAIKLKWFNAPSNLHRVWDEQMISQYGMSYTELANDLPYKTKDEIESIQSGTLLDWVYESQKLAETAVYPSAKSDENLYYKYQYDYFPIVKEQLEKGGLRLAKILDGLF